MSACVDLLSVGFHVALLKVGSEPVHVLVVRKHRVSLCPIKVDVPNAQQTQDGRYLGEK